MNSHYARRLLNPSPRLAEIRLMYAIEAEHLGKRFRQVEAVRDLNLQVAPGEIFGMIGPDGAGKTTAMRLLAAVMLPSSGRVRVLGHDTRRAEVVRRSIGYMPQKFSLYGDLSVQENLDFFADVFDVHGAERRRRMEGLLAFARLGDFRTRRAGQLSGGMQKKLGLACTLVHAPRVVLLDEPTTGVDPISRREFWDILANLHVEGVTLVVSTPYMDEAERCSRVGLMYEGQIIECGAPDALRRRVPGDLLAIWTTQLAGARLALAGLPGVLETQTYGDVLHVFVEDAEAMLPIVQARLEEARAPVREIKRTTPRVEEAFISIIRERRSAGRLP